jgi:hypothetical protein
MHVSAATVPRNDGKLGNLSIAVHRDIPEAKASAIIAVPFNNK